MNSFQKACLYLAKYSILEEFGIQDKKEIDLSDSQFKEKRACFVTLKMDDELRGCIGSIVPHRYLKDDIIANAKSAAFGDPRFSPLTQGEVQGHRMNIGITILSPLQEKTFKNEKELYTFLDKEHCGLVISLGYKQATFLPSVWEELPIAQEFIKHLLWKAGISSDEFLDNFDKISFQIYYGEEFVQDRNII